MRAAGLLALTLLCAAPAAAQAQELSILAGNSQTSASIDMLVIGPPFAQVQLSEIVAGARVPLQTVATGEGTPYANGEIHGTAPAPSLVTWRCDRRNRDFVGTVTFGDGRVVEDFSGVRTPSCDKRFKFYAPAKVRPGAKGSIRASDTWHLGDFNPNLCVKPPKGTYRCRKLGIRAGRSRVATTQRFGAKGTWVVQLRGPTRRLTNYVAVGVKVTRHVVPNPRVLLFGDSLMSNLVTPISDKLGRRIDVLEALRGGSGLLDPTFNWFNYAKAQIAKRHPKAAAILIGAGDGFPLTGADGVKVTCCGEAWSDLYAVKVARMMKIMRNGGKTKAVWIINPAMRGQERVEFVKALARAAKQGAEGIDGVVLTNLGDTLTPGGVYMDSISVGGKTVRVRAVDGVHLTVAGSDIAARQVVKALKPLPR